MGNSEQSKIFSRFRDLQRDMSWRDQKQHVERPELSFLSHRMRLTQY